MPKLTFILEDGQEIIVPLTDRVTIGSTEQNDVFVDDERVSTQHAELLLNADGSVQVFDLKSAAGTFVNGERVNSHTLLDGDKLDFGPLKAVLDLELPPAPAITTKTRRVPAALPEPKAIPSEELRLAENRLALLEAAARQAEARHHEWLAALEKAGSDHAEKSKALAELSSRHDERVAALATTEKQLDALKFRVQDEEGKIAAALREHAEAVEKTQIAQQGIKAAEERLKHLQAQIAEQAVMEPKLLALQSGLAEAEKRQKAHETAIAGLQQERAHQEQALVKVETSLAEAQAALSTCRAELYTGRRQVEELQSRRVELEAASSAPLEDLHRRVEKAREHLATLEARLRPLRDWKEVQERRLAQMSLLPPNSTEARELLREIDSEAAELLQIVSIPPSRTPRVIQVEPPFFDGVLMKSGHVRVQMGSVTSDDDEET